MRAIIRYLLMAAFSNNSLAESNKSRSPVSR